MKNNTESRLTRIRNTVTKDGGFTLIEVLAVMVIVGLLSAIAIPQIGKFRERAHVTSMKSDARNLINEAEGIYTDTNEYPTAAPAVALSPNNSVSAWEAPSENGVNFTISSSKTEKTVRVVNSKIVGTGTGTGGGGEVVPSGSVHVEITEQVTAEDHTFDFRMVASGFEADAIMCEVQAPALGLDILLDVALSDGAGISEVFWFEYATLPAGFTAADVTIGTCNDITGGEWGPVVYPN